MSSETDDATDEPEAIESLGSGKAWYHNKAIQGGVLVLLPLVAGIVAYRGAVTAQAPSDPPPPPPPAPTAAAPVKSSVDEIGAIVPPQPVGFAEALVDDVIVPTPTAPPPAEAPPPASGAFDSPASGPAFGVLPVGRDMNVMGEPLAAQESQWDQRMAEYRSGARYEALTSSPMAEAGGGAWGSYFAKVSAEVALDQERNAQAVAALAQSSTQAVEPARFKLLAGTPIHAVVERATRSDATNVPLMAVVVRDVLDARDSSVIAIPRGSRLVGVHAGVTWNRVRGFWRGVQFSNGETVPLSAALAAHDGAGGMRGRLHTGTLRRLGVGVLAATIGAAASIGADEPTLVAVPGDEGRVIPVQSPEARARRQLGEELASMTRAEVEMMADRQIPYVNVSAGKRVLAVLTEDLLF